MVKPPNNTSYFVGDSLDLTGIEMDATYVKVGPVEDVENVTDNCVYSMNTGDVLNTEGVQNINATFTDGIGTVTENFSVDVLPLIVDFATGTNEQLYRMLQAHYAGIINIHDHWNVGDTRTVHLNAMAATEVGESHAEQDVEIVLMNAGGITDTSGTECAFVWGMKDCLKEMGYLNSLEMNTGGWPLTDRAIWCENVLYPAFGSDFNRLFREFKHTSCNGRNGSFEVAKVGHCALFSEKMVFGDINFTGSVEDSHPYLQWYQTTNNRIKTANGSACDWSLSSPDTTDSGYFVCVDSRGDVFGDTPSIARGISAFGLFQIPAAQKRGSIIRVSFIIPKFEFYFSSSASV